MNNFHVNSLPNHAPGFNDHYFQRDPLPTLHLGSYFHSFKGDTSLQTLYLGSHLHSLWVTPHPRPCTWGHMFHSSCCRGIRPYLEFRGNSVLFRLVAGNSRFHLSCNGDLGIPLLRGEGVGGGRCGGRGKGEGPILLK